MTLSRGDREQIERDLAQCGKVRWLLDAIVAEYANPSASRLTDVGRPSGLVGAKGPHEGGVDLTPWAAAKLAQNDEYQRLLKLQKACRRLRSRLTLTQRRVQEVFYWQGKGEDVTCALLGIAPRTLRHYREQIVRVALEEFQRAGIETYQDLSADAKEKARCTRHRVDNRTSEHI